MRIEIEPTGAFETFKGVQFRLYRGVTERGVEVQFLGMFRIANPKQRVAFEQEVGAIPVEGVTPLIRTPTLINP